MSRRRRGGVALEQVGFRNSDAGHNSHNEDACTGPPGEAAAPLLERRVGLAGKAKGNYEADGYQYARSCDFILRSPCPSVPWNGGQTRSKGIASRGESTAQLFSAWAHRAVYGQF